MRASRTHRLRAAVVVTVAAGGAGCQADHQHQPTVNPPSIAPSSTPAPPEAAPNDAACPDSAPTHGDPCGDAPLECRYPRGSCAAVEASCADGKWQVLWPSCNPPPPQ